MYHVRVIFYCVLQYFRDVTSLTLAFRDDAPWREDCCCSAVMMWMNNSSDLQKLIFFIKNRQTHHHRGVSWRCFGGTVSRILLNYNTFCMLRRCRCVKNRISVANLCKLQYFLYVASLPLFSKGFQLKAVGFPIPGRSRPGLAPSSDVFLKDFN